MLFESLHHSSMGHFENGHICAGQGPSRPIIIGSEPHQVQVLLPGRISDPGTGNLPVFKASKSRRLYHSGCQPGGLCISVV